jgi:hypothetical protein
LTNNFFILIVFVLISLIRWKQEFFLQTSVFFKYIVLYIRGQCGRDRYVVGLTTTYAISAYHHWCEFESRSGRSVQHYVIKFVSDLWQVSGFLPGPPVSSTNKTDRHDITKILLKVATSSNNQTSSNILTKIFN